MKGKETQFNIKVGTGAAITIPKVVITAVLVFALMLLQNLPTVQIPTLDQLYRAVVIAAVAALSLLLNGGSSGGGSTGFTVKVGVGGTITVPKVAVTAILVFALVLLQNLPAMAIPTATDLYKGLVIAAITALGLVLNGGGNASGGSAGRSDIPI